MDGMIRAHCMGTEFPKRDTDGKVKWVPTAGPQDSIYLDVETFTEWYIRPAVRHLLEEEQRVKEKTGAQSPDCVVSHHFAEKDDDLSSWKVKE